MSLGKGGRGKDTTGFEGALGDAHFATGQEVTGAGLLGEKGIRLGYYRDPEDKAKSWGKILRYNGDAHLLTVAPTGSGKGRDVLVGALLEYEGSCIVIDPKGQLAAITRAQRERMGQRIIVLNPLPKELPMDLGPSAKYNPMACLDSDSDAFGPSCEAIADSIVKHEEGPNSHFSDSARQLIAGIIMHLAAHGRDGEKNLVMMQKLISGPSEALEGFISEALAADKEGFITGKLARFEKVSGEDRELRSIISTAITQCGFINNRAIGGSLSDSDFAFRDLKREPTTVYLVLPAKFIEPCGKWFRLVLASAIAELWSDERGKYPILAILDEFAQLGRLSVIADAMGMARGFGLQLWPILQDLTQLRQHYGDRWETFLGGAAVRQFFGPREQFTADYVSKLCGVKTVVAQGQSVQHARELLQADATGTSWGQHAQPLLHPHNVSALGPQEALVLGPQNIVIDAFRRPFFATEDLAALASPDPYHKQDVAPPSDNRPPSDAPAENFAEREWAAAGVTRNSLARNRPLFLRLLTWRSSDNAYWNVAWKIEYVLTLPLRLPAAVVAAPFAIHNRPLQAVIGFIALFGFWEVWEGFAKQPFLDIYKIEEKLCKEEEFLNGSGSITGHTMACRAEALRFTAGFFWQHAILAIFKEGPTKAFSDFDLAFEKEEILAMNEPFRVSAAVIRREKQSPLKGHTLPRDEKTSVTADPARQPGQPQANSVSADGHAEQPSIFSRIMEWFRGGGSGGPQLANAVVGSDTSAADNQHVISVSGKGVRFIEVIGFQIGNLRQVNTSKLQPSLPPNIVLVPQTDGHGVRAGVNIGGGVGAAYLYHTGSAQLGGLQYVLVPARDLPGRTQPHAPPEASLDRNRNSMLVPVNAHKAKSSPSSARKGPL